VTPSPPLSHRGSSMYRRRKREPTQDAQHDVMAFENPMYDEQHRKENPQYDEEYDEPANLVTKGTQNSAFSVTVAKAGAKPTPTEDQEDMYVDPTLLCAWG
jgi:hypothetical protein